MSVCLFLLSAFFVLLLNMLLSPRLRRSCLFISSSLVSCLDCLFVSSSLPLAPLPTCRSLPIVDSADLSLCLCVRLSICTSTCQSTSRSVSNFPLLGYERTCNRHRLLQALYPMNDNSWCIFGDGKCRGLTPLLIRITSNISAPSSSSLPCSFILFLHSSLFGISLHVSLVSLWPKDHQSHWWILLTKVKMLS